MGRHFILRIGLHLSRLAALKGFMRSFPGTRPRLVSSLARFVTFSFGSWTAPISRSASCVPRASLLSWRRRQSAIACRNDANVSCRRDECREADDEIRICQRRKAWLPIGGPELGESCPSFRRCADICYIPVPVRLGHEPRVSARWQAAADVKLVIRLDTHRRPLLFKLQLKKRVSFIIILRSRYIKS